jgi:hypothetical protein
MDTVLGGRSPGLRRPELTGLFTPFPSAVTQWEIANMSSLTVAGAAKASNLVPFSSLQNRLMWQRIHAFVKSLALYLR